MDHAIVTETSFHGWDAIRLSNDLIEAARIEGASEIRIFRSVVLPSLTPILITLGLFTFLAAWNDFFWPLIITNSDATRTIPVGLATFVGRGLSMQFGIVMSSAVTATIPALIFFLLLQRYFVQGISTTGMKG